MKYKAGDVIKYAHPQKAQPRYDLIVEADSNSNQYVTFMMIELKTDVPDIDVWAPYTLFETDNDVLVKDLDIIDKVNRQYKAYQLQKILSK